MKTRRMAGHKGLQISVYSVPNTGVTRDFHLSALAHHAWTGPVSSKEDHTHGQAQHLLSQSLSSSVLPPSSQELQMKAIDSLNQCSHSAIHTQKQRVSVHSCTRKHTQAHLHTHTQVLTEMSHSLPLN